MLFSGSWLSPFCFQLKDTLLSRLILLQESCSEIPLYKLMELMSISQLPSSLVRLLDSNHVLNHVLTLLCTGVLERPLLQGVSQELSRGLRSYASAACCLAGGYFMVVDPGWWCQLCTSLPPPPSPSNQTINRLFVSCIPLSALVPEAHRTPQSCPMPMAGEISERELGTTGTGGS